MNKNKQNFDTLLKHLTLSVVLGVYLFFGLVYGQENVVFVNDFSNEKYIDFNLITFKNSISKVITSTKSGQIAKSDILSNDSIFFIPFGKEKIVLTEIYSNQDTIFIKDPYLELKDIIVTKKPIKKIGKTNSRGINHSFMINYSSLNRVKIDSTLLGKKIISLNFYYKNIKSQNFKNNNAELNVVIIQSDEINIDENNKFVQYVKLSEDSKRKKGWVQIDLKEFDLFVEDNKYIYFGIENISRQFSTKSSAFNSNSGVYNCKKLSDDISNRSFWSCDSSHRIPSYYIEIH